MTARLKIQSETVRSLYEIGVPVERIASEIGAKRDQVKRVVRRDGLLRDRSRYSQGVAHMALAGEEFRESCVPGYWVSDQGRVIAMMSKPGTVLKQQADEDGYLRVHLYQEGRSPIHMQVHRMVALAFIGAPSPGEAVAHNNGRRTDNRVTNLRWATQAENVADKALHGTEQIGSRHGNSKASEAEIAEVKRLLRSGLTLAEVASATGVSFHIVADVSSGRTWRHVE